MCVVQGPVMGAHAATMDAIKKHQFRLKPAQQSEKLSASNQVRLIFAELRL